MKQSWKDAFFASMITRHGRPLMKFFLSRLPNAAEAPDLVQEVYLRMLRLERPDLIRCPEAYLFTIAANIAREHRLKSSTRPPHIALDEAPMQELPSDVEVFATAVPEEAASRAGRVAELETVLTGLSPKARATLIWHRRDGQTYKEIGARLGISTNMVKKYLSQALAYCRKNLSTDQEESRT